MFQKILLIISLKSFVWESKAMRIKYKRKSQNKQYVCSFKTKTLLKLKW